MCGMIWPVGTWSDKIYIYARGNECTLIVEMHEIWLCDY